MKTIQYTQLNPPPDEEVVRLANIHIPRHTREMRLPHYRHGWVEHSAQRASREDELIARDLIDLWVNIKTKGEWAKLNRQERREVLSALEGGE